MVFAGKRPTTLGVHNGQLAPCPSTPNCVCSQSSDPENKIAPLAYDSTSEAAMAALKQVIASMPRTTVIEESQDYLYAEFKSALMGFVDDVEFYLDHSATVIHVRSASRLGKSDLGVNRKRIEEIRARLSSQLQKEVEPV